MYSCTIMPVIDKLQKVKIKAVNPAANSMHLNVSLLCSIYVVFNTVLVETNQGFKRHTLRF